MKYSKTEVIAILAIALVSILFAVMLLLPVIAWLKSSNPLWLFAYSLIAVGRILFNLLKKRYNNGNSIH